MVSLDDSVGLVFESSVSFRGVEFEGVFYLFAEGVDEDLHVDFVGCGIGVEVGFFHQLVDIGSCYLFGLSPELFEFLSAEFDVVVVAHFDVEFVSIFFGQSEARFGEVG